MEMEYITSRQNPLMVQTVKLLTSRKHRRAQGMFAGEGTKLLEEAVRWIPQQLHTVILREGVVCPPLPQHVRQVTVPHRLMDQISSVETSEGAVFLATLPSEPMGAVAPGTLVLDGIQDPGNVGTILRTADALDVPVLLTQGCADPYNPKTVRATMGAVFRTPPGNISRENLVEQCKAHEIPLMATALSSGAEDIRQAKVKEAAVVIGSEGQGVSSMLLAAASNRLVIPMHPRCESLNAAVAAAIVLWQMTEL